MLGLHFCSIRNWLKGKWLVVISIALCLSVIFALEAVKPVVIIPSPLSINSISQNYALLPTIFRLDSNLPRAKLSKTDGRLAGAQNSTFALGTYGQPTQNAYFIPYSVSYLDSIFERGTQQACQLLDIPPPSSVFSSHMVPWI